MHPDRDNTSSSASGVPHTPTQGYQDHHPRSLDISSSASGVPPTPIQGTTPGQTPSVPATYHDLALLGKHADDETLDRLIPPALCIGLLSIWSSSTTTRSKVSSGLAPLSRGLQTTPSKSTSGSGVDPSRSLLSATTPFVRCHWMS